MESSFQGCPAKLLTDEKSSQFLWALGKAFNEAKREVYKRSVIGSEPFSVRGKTGILQELQKRGWSQVEAQSIYLAACAAQDSTIESTKLAIQTTQDALVKTEKKLEKAMRSKKKKHTRHGLARRKMRLENRIKELETRLVEDRVRVCFGSRKTLRSTRTWEACEYSSQTEAREVWRRRRAGEIMVVGGRQFPEGNSSIRVRLSENPEDQHADKVKIRVPAFLRHLIDDQEWVSIPVQGFPEDYGRDKLLEATYRDPDDNTRKRKEHKEKRARYLKRLELISQGQLGPEPQPVPKSPPQITCKAPVTGRIYWREDKEAWYMEASFKRETVEKLPKYRNLTLGIDINPDHLAYILVTPEGNPLPKWSGRIDLDLTGSHNQVRDNIGCAIRELTGVAKEIETHFEERILIAHERLDFKRARGNLRYESPRLARLLSSFAYNQIITILINRASREGFQTKAVNPAYTSVIGQANYACPYGISVDQAAAVIIARRALGFSTPIRSSLLVQWRSEEKGGATGPPEDGPGGKPQHLKLTLREVSKRLPKRRATWSDEGLKRSRRDSKESLLPISSTSESREGNHPGAGGPDKSGLACRLTSNHDTVSAYELCNRAVHAAHSLGSRFRLGSREFL